MDNDLTVPGYYYAIAGAASGCITRFICQPLDVVKIRFQLQVEPIKSSSTSKYHSMSQTIVLITKEENIYALWKGHIPAQMLSIVYGTCQFYVYNIVNNHFARFGFLNDKTKSMHLLSGALAGSFATFVTFPLDIVRTRLIAQSSQNQAYNGMLHSCIKIYKHESMRGLYRGLIPALIQIAPHTGIQFWSYELLKNINFLLISQPKKPNYHNNVSVINSLIAGCLTGLLAKSIVYPLDLVKKRLQIQGFQKSRIGFGEFFLCNSLRSCLVLTVKKEGIQGLFKGLVPSLFKAALSTALHFTVYEQILNSLRSL
ncbi:PREDICTED: mitochondrial thiamine pyrophosphate carrier [Ceratosolen solmsi marchali]|uniref:Mitochondrial thiamine pyrophosphate carrier n=1 Tax=Ceratosolen solmsi marchali TaxID=326594 RepID=A0AAJ6YV05_9HYME|nr:PREDICTED: mitochondrial thiamine pyrophosphate carrier [Ceratosolen solmsi marchali]